MGKKEGEDGESGREWRIEEVGRVRGRKKRGLRREMGGEQGAVFMGRSKFFMIKNTHTHTRQSHRVAVVGNVDAGKSTLLGVLTHGELDNGRGTARQRLFRHKHEMETGRTSSVGNDILGFDSEGRVVNKTDGHGE